MITQEQVKGLDDGERAGAGPHGWDAALGSAYARIAGRPIARNAGRFVVALLLALLLTAKWKTLSTMLADDQLGAGGTDWALLLNNALQIPFLALATLLVVIRGPQIRGTGRFSGVVVALSGTLIPSLLIYDSGARSDASLAAVAALLLLGGMIWAVWSLAVLGRCFAMVPEVRGLVTRGPYRWVRHPIYLGEVVATLGLLLPILSVFHVAIFAAFLGLQLWRTKYEETGLSATFPEYRAYRSRTARLVPGLW
ncbi:MAG TPA: isoprenylcysteine carboxylmethyltransferase family protein [Nitrolancea sp.]|nr:isoprenylcysteine carboxylmethyltransferase family protein [Nitrolancea sp.]